MALKSFKERVREGNLSPKFGTIKKISSTTIEAQGLRPSIGDIVNLISLEDTLKSELGMVTEIDQYSFFISPFWVY